MSEIPPTTDYSVCPTPSQAGERGESLFHSVISRCSGRRGGEDSRGDAPSLPRRRGSLCWPQTQSEVDQSRYSSE